jgi:hypothetical protein
VKTKQVLRLVFGTWIASATFLMLGCDDSKPADATKPAAGAPTKPADTKPTEEPKKPT